MTRRRAAVLVVSDRAAAGQRDDATAPLLRERLEAMGFAVTDADAVPDEREVIAAALRRLAEEHALVLTTGGTGLAPRDVTPEATRDVIEREAPGFPEEMRRRSAERFPRAILSRAVAGIVGETLILNLPGSPKGARECLDYVADALSHGITVLGGRLKDCLDDPVPETGA